MLIKPKGAHRGRSGRSSGQARWISGVLQFKAAGLELELPFLLHGPYAQCGLLCVPSWLRGAFACEGE
jgi:hypothetical protein